MNGDLQPSNQGRSGVEFKAPRSYADKSRDRRARATGGILTFFLSPVISGMFVCCITDTRVAASYRLGMAWGALFEGLLVFGGAAGYAWYYRITCELATTFGQDFLDRCDAYGWAIWSWLYTHWLYIAYALTGVAILETVVSIICVAVGQKWYSRLVQRGKEEEQFEQDANARDQLARLNMAPVAVPLPIAEPLVPNNDYAAPVADDMNQSIVPASSGYYEQVAYTNGGAGMYQPPQIPPPTNSYYQQQSVQPQSGYYDQNGASYTNHTIRQSLISNQARYSTTTPASDSYNASPMMVYYDPSTGAYHHPAQNYYQATQAYDSIPQNDVVRPRESVIGQPYVQPSVPPPPPTYDAPPPPVRESIVGVPPTYAGESLPNAGDFLVSYHRNEEKDPNIYSREGASAGDGHDRMQGNVNDPQPSDEINEKSKSYLTAYANYQASLNVEQPNTYAGEASTGLHQQPVQTLDEPAKTQEEDVYHGCSEKETVTTSMPSLPTFQPPAHAMSDAARVFATPGPDESPAAFAYAPPAIVTSDASQSQPILSIPVYVSQTEPTKSENGTFPASVKKIASASSVNSAREKANPMTWSSAQVGQWLKDSGYPAPIISAFQAKSVDGPGLCLMTEERLVAELKLDPSIWQTLSEDFLELRRRTRTLSEISHH